MNAHILKTHMRRSYKRLPAGTATIAAVINIEIRLGMKIVRFHAYFTAKRFNSESSSARFSRASPNHTRVCNCTELMMNAQSGMNTDTRAHGVIDDKTRATARAIVSSNVNMPCRCRLRRRESSLRFSMLCLMNFGRLRKHTSASMAWRPCDQTLSEGNVGRARSTISHKTNIVAHKIAPRC